MMIVVQLRECTKHPWIVLFNPGLYFMAFECYTNKNTVPHKIIKLTKCFSNSRGWNQDKDQQRNVLLEK